MNSLVKYVDEVVREFIPTKTPFKPSAQALLKDKPEEIWDKRANEPDYAKLAQQKARALNVYDQPIDLIALVSESVPREQSLYINGNPAVGDNPDRNKQHGFYFDADNCIGCHACESACAEKNETPAHLAFRSVGYVEGGSYPDFKRLNISMACNHCDDPVCLKGCPTAAYTKHTEYGAVLQDPDTCFGCGYCTWVCPYNAPQLDPIEGQVSKCNMCVDRLEVGLKPACVSACVGNALDFGVIENIPAHREQAKTSIPGFPDPSISQPNIRFQQLAGLPEEMTRTDSAPIKYHLDPDTGQYRPGVDPKHGQQKCWNLANLNSRENPLVLFTLTVQAGIGALAIAFLGKLLGVTAMQPLAQSPAYAWLAFIAAGLAATGLLLSTTHLGKPMRFYRGFNNLRYSPVSREGLGVALFVGFAGLHWLLSLLPFSNSVLRALQNTSGALAVLGGAGGLYYMVKCYRIPARPFWNHWQTATSFCGSALMLGTVVAGGFALFAATPAQTVEVLTGFGAVFAAGAGLELLGLYYHARYNCGAAHEGAASHYVLTTTYGKSYIARNVLLATVCLGATLLLLAMNFDAGGMALPAVAPAIAPAFASVFVKAAWVGLAVVALVTSLVGRALFYVLVIPTTMPGAFFWRNKGFEEHARATGLNEVVAMGVVSEAH